MEPVRRTTVVVNNTTIINKTVNISNTKVVNNTVINEGPATAAIEKASGRKVQAVPVQELRHKEEAAVVARQRTPASAGENKVQTPVRSEAQPAEKKAVAAHEPPQVEKPAVATHESVAPASKNSKAQSETRKPVPAAAESKSEAKPEARPVAIKEPIGQKTGKHFGKQEMPARPSDKKVQQPATEKPAASEKNGANPGDKDHENNPKE
jgi:hypothetical protein